IMKINDSLRFAHPVFSKATKDFGDYTLDFTVQISESLATGALSLACSLSTDHPQFRQAIAVGHVRSYLNIVCRDTYFNEFRDLNLGETVVEVSPGLLRGRTSLRVICIAAKSLDVTGWNGLDREFPRSSCHIGPPSVVALSEGRLLDVGLDKIRPLSSIFRLEKYDNLEEDTIAVRIDSQT